ncbi:MAG: hypothetical protein WCT29_03625 [Candidatus Paceibacterota bacterium]|jgi:hypothetical protein
MSEAVAIKFVPTNRAQFQLASIDRNIRAILKLVYAKGKPVGSAVGA